MKKCSPSSLSPWIVRSCFWGSFDGETTRSWGWMRFPVPGQRGQKAWRVPSRSISRSLHWKTYIYIHHWGNSNNVTFQVQSSRPTVVLNAPHVSKHIRHTKRFSGSVRLSYSTQVLSLLPSIKGGLSRCVFLSVALLLLNISHTHRCHGSTFPLGPAACAFCSGHCRQDVGTGWKAWAWTQAQNLRESRRHQIWSEENTRRNKTYSNTVYPLEMA